LPGIGGSERVTGANGKPDHRTHHHMDSSPYRTSSSSSPAALDPFGLGLEGALDHSELRDLHHSYGSPSKSVFGSSTGGKQRGETQQSHIQQQQAPQQPQQQQAKVPLHVQLRQRLEATQHVNYSPTTATTTATTSNNVPSNQQQQKNPQMPPHMMNFNTQQQSAPPQQRPTSLPPHVLAAASMSLPPHLARLRQTQQQSKSPTATAPSQPQKAKPQRSHPTKSSQPKKRQKLEKPAPASNAEYFPDAPGKTHLESMLERYYRNQFLINGYDLAKYPAEVPYIPQRKDHVYLLKKGYDDYREQMRDETTLWDKLYVGPYFRDEQWPFSGTEVIEAIIEELKYEVKRTTGFYTTIQGVRNHGYFGVSLVKIKFVQVGTNRHFQMLYSELVGQVEWMLHKPLMDAALNRVREIDAELRKGAVNGVPDSVKYDASPAHGRITELNVAGSSTLPADIQSHLQDLWGSVNVTFDDGSTDSVSPWELDSTNVAFQRTFKEFYKFQALPDKVREDAIRELTAILNDRSIVLPLLTNTSKRLAYPLAVGTIIQRLQHMFYSSKHSFLNDLEHLTKLLKRESTDGDDVRMDSSIQRIIDCYKSLKRKIEPKSDKKSSSKTSIESTETQAYQPPPPRTTTSSVLPPHLLSTAPAVAAAAEPPPHMRAPKLVLKTEKPKKDKKKSSKKTKDGKKDKTTTKKSKDTKKTKKQVKTKKSTDKQKDMDTTKKAKGTKKSKKEDKKTTSTKKKASSTKTPPKKKDKVKKEKKAKDKKKQSKETKKPSKEKEFGKITIKMAPEPDPFEFNPEPIAPSSMAPPDQQPSHIGETPKLKIRPSTGGQPPHLAAAAASGDKNSNRLRSLAPTPVVLPGRPIQKIDQYYTAPESASPCLQSYNNFIETVHTPKRVIPPRFRDQQHKKRMKMEQLARQNQQVKSVANTITSFLGQRESAGSPVPDIAALHQKLKSNSLKPVGFNVALETVQDKPSDVPPVVRLKKAFKWSKQAQEDSESLNSDAADVLMKDAAETKEERIEHAWKDWQDKWSHNPPPMPMEDTCDAATADAMEVSFPERDATVPPSGQLAVYIPLQHNLTRLSVPVRAVNMSASMTQDIDEEEEQQSGLGGTMYTVHHDRSGAPIHIKASRRILPASQHVSFTLYEYLLVMRCTQDVVVPVDVGVEMTSTTKRALQSLPLRVLEATQQCSSQRSMFFTPNIEQAKQCAEEYGFLRDFEWNACGFLHLLEKEVNGADSGTRVVRIVSTDKVMFRVGEQRRFTVE